MRVSKPRSESAQCHFRTRKCVPERQQHVQHQPPHRIGRVELLGHRNKRNLLPLEDFEDPGEVEQRIDQPEKAKAVAIHDFELTRDGGRQLRAAAVQQFFDGTEHERQRRAELVADVREEGDLSPVEFEQRAAN